MSDDRADWTVERRAGRAGELHGLEDPEPVRRTVRVMDVEAPAIVLGSRQGFDVVDAERVDRAGVEVVHRRSGGGAVLLRPGEQVWVDLFVPAGDPLWHDDIGVAAWWVGETWASALERLGLGPCGIHRSGLVRTDWSDLICFSGLGPGEVTVAGRKVVGISQRRNRTFIKIQTTALTTWDPDVLVDLLDLDQRERRQARAALVGAASELAVTGSALVAELVSALP